MPATVQLPETEELEKFLSDLFGLKVQTSESAAANADGIRAMTEYVDSDGNVHGIIACDLSCAARLGAALTQIPMGAVEDSLESGSLSENLAENLAEVLNISVNLFPECHSHRLVAGTMTHGDEAAALFVEKTGGAMISSFELDIQRYGKGTITLARIEG